MTFNPREAVKQIEDDLSNWIYYTAKGTGKSVYEIERMQLRYFIKTIIGIKAESKMMKEINEERKNKMK